MAVWDMGLAQFRDLWGRLSGAQRFAFVGVAVGLGVGFLVIAFWAGTPAYSVLYGRLAEADAAQVVERLRADGVPYQLRENGGTILVPADRVHDLRLTMAGEGIPQGGVVGFEVFDRSSFGMTDFAQKVNYARALEGELTRTIRRLEGVEGARVHLVLPERRLFQEEAEAATASIVLQLASGRSLSAKQVQGVVYLAASSVEGLTPERVTVVDTRGNVLYQAADQEHGLLASNQLEHKRGFEKDVERRVRELLERVLGTGAAVVQVAAVFDFDRVEETSETFDPEATAVRSEERTSESSAGLAGPAGVPGVTSNVGEERGATPGAAGGSSTRETETVNYEVSKKVTRIQRAPGSLSRVTVAVAVDGTYREGEGGAKEFMPRTDEELARLKGLVEKAVGFDARRGDEVEVTSIPFRPTELPAEAKGFAPDFLLALARYGTALVLALLLLWFVVRPLLGWLTRETRTAEVTGPVSVAELERQLGGAAPQPGFELDEATPTETLKRETIKKRLSELVTQEPEVAAQLVRSWMAAEE